ncbi:hypothetical protein [Devosia sp.]|uniref:hypothetical protein n=1 Tax=Devosia sp. TaxID=1871048 RepID=UPI0027332D7C|nr:hypothetical protein [Devosia sp.]MDP2782947.1 hypothetical protein [Devosia sp.]
MSIAYSDHNVSQLRRSIVAMLKRLTIWLAAPPVTDQSRSLPKELENAEDWLLDDLGLKETDDGALPPALPGKDRQR